MTITESEFKANLEEAKQSLIDKLGLEGAEEEIDGISSLISAFQKYSVFIADVALKDFAEDMTPENFLVLVSTAFLSGISMYHTALKFSGINMDDLDKAVIVGLEKLTK